MKYQRLTAGLLACAMVFGIGTILPKQAGFQQSALTASAEQYGIWTYQESEDGTYIIITGCDDTAKSADVPAIIDGLPVTKLVKGSVFQGHEKLKSLTIPDSDIKMDFDWNSFSKNTTPLLNSLTVGNAVETVPTFLPYQKELQTLVIHDGVKKLEKAAFYGCVSLSSVTLPEHMESIGAEAFHSCRLLETFKIPDGITEIGTSTFYQAGLKDITIPVTVEKIGDRAFFECKSLTDVYYAGTEEEWKTIAIEKWGNEALFSATIHYNSAVSEPPTEELEISVSSVIELNKLLKTQEGAPLKFDLNGDSVVNVIDLALLKQKLLSK